MNENYKKYIYFLILSLILSTVGAFIGLFLPVKYITVYSIVSIILIIAFCVSSGKYKKILFHIFCFGEGVLLSPILSKSNTNLLFIAFLGTTIIVAICSYIGYKAKNLSSWGKVLFYLLILGMVLSIISFFIPMGFLSIFFIILFSLYIIYDINYFKNISHKPLTDDEILLEVMNIYLDIINIFVHLLELFASDND